MSTKHAFICSECGYEEWSTDTPVLGGNECPECGCGMTAAASVDESDYNSVVIGQSRGGRTWIHTNE